MYHLNPHTDLLQELHHLKHRLSTLEGLSGDKEGSRETPIEGFDLRYLTDFMPGILYITDFATHDVLWVNYKSLIMLGYNESEIKEQGPRYYMKFFHPDDTGIFDKYHSFFLNEEGRCFHCSYRLRHKNGDWHWFYSSTIVLDRDQELMPRKMLGIAVDISEQIETNEQLKELLKENMHLKDRLIQNLTKREQEVVRFISNGASSKEIASHLHLSHYTVETHRKNAMAKLGVHNTAGLVRFAIEHVI